MQDLNSGPYAPAGQLPIPLLTVSQVCDLLDISVTEFRRRRVTGRIPGLVRLANGGLRVLADALASVELEVAA